MFFPVGQTSTQTAKNSKVRHFDKTKPPNEPLTAFAAVCWGSVNKAASFKTRGKTGFEKGNLNLRAKKQQSCVYHGIEKNAGHDYYCWMVPIYL